MKTYNVHVYREMRLFFPGIVARTVEEAATLAAGMPSGVAEALEDCDGENLPALVGVVDSEDRLVRPHRLRQPVGRRGDQRRADHVSS
jgi:hypothetical protein